MTSAQVRCAICGTLQDPSALDAHQRDDARAWAERQGLDDRITPEQLMELKRILGPALRDVAEERRVARRRGRRAGAAA